MAKKQGVQMHSGHVAGGTFSRLLWAMAQKLPPTERVIKKQRKPNGAKERAQAVLSDTQLAGWRYEYERGGISIKGMADKYGVDRNRMYVLLTYRARADVDPKAPEPVQSGVVSADPRGDDVLISHGSSICPVEPLNATQPSCEAM